MAYKVKEQFKTGDLCERTGEYRFNGYLEQESADAEPANEERVAMLKAGETFPHIVSTEKGCWWKLVE